jgi:hypothetical protein
MRPGRMRALAVLLACVILSAAQEAAPGHDSRVALTVTVAPKYGITLEVYDPCGLLLAQSDPAVPPADVNVGLDDGQSIGVGVPAVALGEPTAVRAYIKATPEKRYLAAEADRKAAERGLSTIPGREAVEFASSLYPGVRTAIRLSYPDGVEEAAVDSLRIFRLDEEEAKWRRLPSCGVDRLTCSISAQTERSAVYRILASTPSDLGRLLVCPNPFAPDLSPGGVVRFINLTRDATIRIFDVEGRLIWKEVLTNSIGATAWGGTTSTGEPASTGIYLFTVTDSHGKAVSGKIALVR